MQLNDSLNCEMLPPTPIASKRRGRGPALAVLAELRDERAVPRSSLFKTSKAPRGAKGACHARILALLFSSSVITTVFYDREQLF